MDDYYYDPEGEIKSAKHIFVVYIALTLALAVLSSELQPALGFLSKIAGVTALMALLNWRRLARELQKRDSLS